MSLSSVDSCNRPGRFGKSPADPADALEIARLIQGTDSDHRGELLKMVATELRMRGQNYTANLLERTAYTYEEGK